MSKVNGSQGYSYLFTAFSKLTLENLVEDKLLKYSNGGWTDIIGKKDSYKNQMTDTVKLGFSLASLLRKYGITSKTDFNSKGKAETRKNIRADKDATTITSSTEYKNLKDGSTDKTYIDSYLTGSN